VTELYLSVVAPCYNEEAVLPEFHRRMSAVCASLHQPYELVLVNDGSRDKTWDRMMEVAARDPQVVCVSLARNHGHQLALTAGLSVCRGERILIIDADLQDPPELLLPMLESMDQGAEVVYGQRRRRQGESAFKLATAALFYRLINKIADVAIPRDTGDFRLVSRRVLEILQSMPERHRFIRGMVSWIGFRQEALLYDRDARFAGETKYPLRKMFKFAVDAITAFSVKPLTFASLAGLLASAIGLGLFVYSLIAWTIGGTVSGWTSLMASVGVLGGMQLLVLGIMGEYLGRLYEQSKGRPLFLIDRIVRADSPSEAVHRPVAAKPQANLPSISIRRSDAA
jgi:dolichol-phosphate mannosyltransferase